MSEERKLAYTVIIDKIDTIPGYDRVELAHVLGWTVMVAKGQFKPGDSAILIEIDSLVPKTEKFQFMEKYNYKVKTQKFCKGTVISQGLLMRVSDFPNLPPDLAVGDDVTNMIGVTYYEPVDVERKMPTENKYKRMARRYPKLFSLKPFRWLMRRGWGQKLLFSLLGNRQDKNSAWPSWVKKTDETRVQNMPWIVEDKNPWFATEKIDGTSTTFTMRWVKRRFKIDYEFKVCSRNMVITKDSIYTEMAEKCDVYNILKDLLVANQNFKYVTIQGEIYGKGVPKGTKREYKVDDRHFAAFNLIVGQNDGNSWRANPEEMKRVLEHYGIECVPVVATDYHMPSTVEEILAYAASEPSQIDGEMREGIVFRSQDGVKSFKAVSNEYLLKYS